MKINIIEFLVTCDCGKTFKVDAQTEGQPDTLACPHCYHRQAMTYQLDEDITDPSCLYDNNEHDVNDHGNCTRCGSYHERFDKYNFEGA